MPNKEEWMKELKRQDENTLVLPCDCESLGHVVHFEITSEGSYQTPQGTFQVFLNRQPSFLKRLLIGFKYIFGLRPSHWYEIDGTLLNEYQLTKLRDFITEKLNSNGSI